MRVFLPPPGMKIAYCREALSPPAWSLPVFLEPPVAADVVERQPFTVGAPSSGAAGRPSVVVLLLDDVARPAELATDGIGRVGLVAVQSVVCHRLSLR